MKVEHICVWKQTDMECLYPEQVDREIRSGHVAMRTVCANCERWGTNGFIGEKLKTRFGK